MMNSLQPPHPSSTGSGNDMKPNKSKRKGGNPGGSAPKTSDESKRARNILTAKRHKERLSKEHHWMEIQAAENEDKIRKLEKRARHLMEQLDSGSRPSPSVTSENKHESRPKWFGDPF